MKLDTPSNPLALAALSLLNEKPMHPYEIAFTMKDRHLEESIKLNFGSLYHTIDGLAEAGWIAPVETARDGRRPEKTVYALTDAGRAQLLGWLRELIRTPVKDYMRFEAGLSFIHDLSAAEAAGLLRERVEKLAADIEFWRLLMQRLYQEGLGRLHLIEIEHAQALRTAELKWIKSVAEEIDNGKLEWLIQPRRHKEEAK